MWCQKLKKKKEHTLPILEKNVVNWPSLVCTLFRTFVISQYNVNQDTSFLIKKKERRPDKGTREEKKKGPKSKQKTTPKSAERTMGSAKRRKH